MSPRLSGIIDEAATEPDAAVVGVTGGEGEADADKEAEKAAKKAKAEKAKAEKAKKAEEKKAEAEEADAEGVEPAKKKAKVKAEPSLSGEGGVDLNALLAEARASVGKGSGE